MNVEPITTPIRVLLVDDQALIRSGFSLILSLEEDIDVVGEAGDGAAALDLARSLRPDVVLMDVQMPVRDGISATSDVVAEGLGKVVILTTFDRDDYLFDALRAGASGFLLKNTDPEHLVEAVRRVASGDALLAPEVTRRVIEAMTAAGEGGALLAGPRAAGEAAAASGCPTAGREARADLARTASGAQQAESVSTLTGSAPAARGVAASHPVDPAGPATTQPAPTEKGAASSDAAAAHSVEDEAAAATPPAPTDPRLAHLTAREREVLTLVAHGLSNGEIARQLFLGEATVKTHVSNCFAKLHLRDRVQAVVLAYEAGLVTPGA